MILIKIGDRYEHYLKTGTRASLDRGEGLDGEEVVNRILERFR